VTGLHHQATNHWKYPTIDELIDARERFQEVADQLGSFVQAYVMGGEQVHVHIQLALDGQRHGVCVSFSGFRYPVLDSRNIEDWLPISVYELGIDTVCQQIQAPVFVPIAHDLELEQGMGRGISNLAPWPSVERLQSLECCLGAGRGVLELPANPTLRVFLPPLIDVVKADPVKAIDRELASVVVLLAGTSDQGGDEVVKASTGVVGKVSEAKRPIRTDLFQRYLEDVMAGVSIEFSKDGLAVNVAEPFNRFPKNVEVVHRSSPLAFVVPEVVAHGA
jgi:hypothetical protein